MVTILRFKDRLIQIPDMEGPDSEISRNATIQLPCSLPSLAKSQHEGVEIGP